MEEKLKQLMGHALYCDLRETRTGPVRSTFGGSLSHDMSQGFPAVTSKKLAWRAVVGELLWFLSGSDSLSDLRYYTFGDPNSDKWTIWDDDTKRWQSTFDQVDRDLCGPDWVGELYPIQWRRHGRASGSCVDQIVNLVNSIKTKPHNRDHVVMAWSPVDIRNDAMALKPCHMGFQCYVNDGKLSLMWFQRSWDLHLGAPFNIASYGLLLHLLAKWTDLEVGQLIVSYGDAHVYEAHKPQAEEFIRRSTYDLPTLVLPEGTETLESTLKLTALDFKNALVNYQSHGALPAVLKVG